jgi:hypothetical protein
LQPRRRARIRNAENNKTKQNPIFSINTIQHAARP